MTDTNPETTPEENAAPAEAAPVEAAAVEAAAVEAVPVEAVAADAAPTGDAPAVDPTAAEVAAVEAALGGFEAEAPAADADAPAPAPLRLPRANVTAHNPIWTVGRRKASSARVRMYPGEGNISINGRELREYFNREDHQHAVVSPLVHSDIAKDVDIRINVHGGGITGQAGAIRMGIARGLSELRPDLEQGLRDGGFMTRDARVVERKKYGRRGARRGFQFSKR